MTGKQAIQEMLKGKKVRRSIWSNSEYIHFTTEGFVGCRNYEYRWCLLDSKAADWEIYDPPTKFSDVPVGNMFTCCGMKYVKCNELFYQDKFNAVPLSLCDKQLLYLLPDSEVSYEL